MKKVWLVTTLMLAAANFAAAQKNPESMLGTALHQEEVDGDLKGAVAAYQKVLAMKGVSHKTAAEALLHLGQCYEKLGDAQWRRTYERVVRDFSDQTEAARMARSRLEASPSKGRGVSLRQACAGSDCGIDSRISPDGRYMSLVKNGNPSVRDLSSGQIRELSKTPIGKRVSVPHWSPDAKRLAYSVTEPNVGFSTMVVNLDGAGAREVHRGEVHAWSADGKRVLISNPEGSPKDPIILAWLSLADGRLQVLPTSHPNLDLAFISPDGQYIAFNAGKDRGTEENVYIMTSDGSAEFVVSPNSAYQEPFGWSPDGKYLLYGQYGDTVVTLWATAISGGKVQGLPQQVQGDFGRESVFNSSGITRSGTLYYRMTKGISQQYTASLDPTTGKITSAPSPLPFSRSGDGWQAHWSPDGRRIVHAWEHNELSVQYDNQELAVYSLETSKDQRVASGAVVLRTALCWGSDGESLLFNTPRGPDPKQSEPVRFNLNTGETSPLFPGALSFTIRSCSENGLVADWNNGSIKVRNLKTKSEAEVHRGGQTTPILSHDGRWIAFLETLGSGAVTLNVISTEGGAVRELATAMAPVQFSAPRGIAWSPDDRYVYFLANATAGSPAEVFRVPAAGGKQESAGLKWPGLRRLEIAPDGKRIILESSVRQQELWSMENFLPSAK